MKKFIAMLVAMLLCVTAVFGLAACGDEGGDDDTTPPVVVTAEDAIKEIETLYGRDAKETSANYDLMGIVTVNGKKFNVDWTVTDETNQVTIAKTEVFVKDADGNDTTTVDYRYYTVTLPKIDKDAAIDYTITATITEGETTKTATFERTAVHAHVFADATCDSAKACDCGETEGEALGCIDENFDLKCDRCSEAVEYEIPTLEGEGISDVPYIITEAGKNICAFPGGWEFIWYSFTATDNGYVTVSSAFATAWMQIGGSIDNTTYNEGDGSSVKFLAKANQTVYIGIADWDEQVTDIPFTVAFEAVEFKDVAFLAGNWSGTEIAEWGFQNTVLNINADGAGTGYYADEWGTYNFDITSIIYVGDDIIINTLVQQDWGDSTNTITFTYTEADGNKTLTTANGFMSCELVLVPYEDEPIFNEPVETPVYDTEIIIGDNYLFFSADEVAAGAATRPMFLIDDNTYYFDAFFTVSAITDLEGNAITANDDGSYTLTAGNYMITFAIASDSGIEADVKQYLFVYNPLPDDGGEEDPFYVGTWGGVEGSNYGDTTYVFTFDAFGFGYGSYTMGEYTTTFDVTSINVEENVITVETITTGDFAGSSTTIVFTYNEVDGTLSTEMAIMGGALTLAPIVPPTPEYELTIGANYINMENVNFTYTATEMGTLKLDVGTAVMGMVEITYTVNGGEVQTLELESFVELNLNAGDVVIIYVVAEGSATLGATWTAAV